jgi:hypothetical protein
MDDFEKEPKVYKKAPKAMLSGLGFFIIHHNPSSIIHHPLSLPAGHKKAPSDDRAFFLQIMKPKI